MLCGVVVGDDGFLGEVNLSRMWDVVPVLSHGLTYSPYTLEAVNHEEYNLSSPRPRAESIHFASICGWLCPQAWWQFCDHSSVRCVPVPTLFSGFQTQPMWYYCTGEGGWGVEGVDGVCGGWGEVQ